MTELVIEILGYIAIAALLGFLLGWLTWGWGHRDRISAARAEGAREARTSLDGSAGPRDQLRASASERARLEAEIDRLTERLAAAEVAAGLRADASEPAVDEDEDAAASPDIPEPSAADVRPAASRPGSSPAVPAGGKARDHPLPATAGRARGGRRAAVPTGGGPTGSPAPEAPHERAPAAIADDRTRRADDLAARLASHGPPDVTLRKQIMSASGTADDSAAKTDGSPGRSEPHMPHPPAFTLRRQRVTGFDEPPVPDEQVPPPVGQAGEPDMPRPAAGTERQQRTPEGGVKPTVVDEQVPPPGGDAAEPDMPRPAATTLRQQRVPEGADEAPVIDEQVPPEPDSEAGARPDDLAARPEATAPASLLTEPPAEIDDLRRIRGVGKVTERLLNRNGIWLYRQLAGLTPAETAWLSGVLDMPESRIERERWIEQAGSLHRGKYGSAEDEPEG